MGIYLRMSDLADRYNLSKNTVRSRAREIEDQIGKRYKQTAVIDDGNIYLISEPVFLDWLKYRHLILNGKEKYADPFKVSDWMEALGYDHVRQVYLA